MASASLVQSFPATPARRLPELWRQRLGEGLGDAIWQRQTRPWWQIWGAEAQGTPFLVLQASGWPAESRAGGANSLAQLLTCSPMILGYLPRD